MNFDLFDSETLKPWLETISEDIYLLHHYALEQAPELWQVVQQVMVAAPPRTLHTPGGKPMSVRSTSCGALGWHSDRHGYRYISSDPLTNKNWPQIPPVIQALSLTAAELCGFSDFVADSCLINQYQASSKMSLHQDRDERDFSWPIVSMSLVLPATFVMGGTKRSDPTIKIPLEHGDILIWGRSARLNFHGVQTIKAAQHPLLGAQRINLTLRRAG